MFNQNIRDVLEYFFLFIFASSIKFLFSNVYYWNFVCFPIMYCIYSGIIVYHAYIWLSLFHMSHLIWNEYLHKRCWIHFQIFAIYEIRSAIITGYHGFPKCRKSQQENLMAYIIAYTYYLTIQNSIHMNS